MPKHTASLLCNFWPAFMSVTDSHRQLAAAQKGKDEGCRLLTGGGKVAGKTKGYWVQVLILPSLFRRACMCASAPLLFGRLLRSESTCE